MIDPAVLRLVPGQRGGSGFRESGNIDKHLRNELTGHERIHDTEAQERLLSKRRPAEFVCSAMVSMTIRVCVSNDNVRITVRFCQKSTERAYILSIAVQM